MRTANYTTQRVTTPTTTTTPESNHNTVKENITPPSPLLHVSQPLPEVRSQSLRKRNRMSPAQLVRLESVFRNEKHPSKQKKMELADELGVNYRTITIWLQNKRQAMKRNGGSVPSAPSRLRTGVTQTPNKQVPLQSPSNASLPSMDNALQPISRVCSEENVRPASPRKQGAVVIGQPPKKLAKVVTPLLSSLDLSIAPKSPSSKALHVNVDQAQSLVASRICAEEQLSSSPAFPSPTSDRGSEAHDAVRDRNDTPCMTLEWACDTQVARRRGASHRSDSKSLNKFWIGPSSQSISPALSLLSSTTGKSPLAPAPPPDVMHGASLLLHFKYSVRGHKSGK